VTPDEAIAEAQSGKLRPVYLLVGEEQHEADRVVSALRQGTLKGGIDGLNDDTLDAPGASVADVISVARTMPMMASRRWVLSRNIQAWETEKSRKKSPQEDGDGRKKPPLAPLDALGEYVAGADASTVLVLVAFKLDKRRKLYTQAKKSGFLVSCEALRRSELPGWIVDRAAITQNRISRQDADLIAELAGPDLAAVADATERVCLYVGPGRDVTELAISECVTRLRTASVWELVSAVGSRKRADSLRLLQDVYDPQDRGLKLIGVLAWAARQLIKFDQAIKDGLSPPDAAKAAGAPPFKARELAAQVRGLSPGTLQHFIEQLKATDAALKGGSRRPPQAVVEQMVLDLCSGG
jgi:DNA polymerase-3 subunit delta